MTVTEDQDKWPAFLTVPEVAVILRISKMSVYRMVHKENIGAIRIGRSFRISADEVRRVLRDGIPAGQKVTL